MTFPILPGGTTGYQIPRSVRLRSSATGYFTRTAGTPTSQNVWTISMWVKMGNMTAGLGTGCFFGANQAGNPNESIKWDGSTTSIYYQAASSGGTNNLTRYIGYNFRDSGSWYHFVFQKNGSANSGTGCFLAWVNGVAVSVYTGGYTGTQASVPDYINVSGSTFNIGAIGSANSLDCYLAEVNFVDGQALTASSFGQINSYGVWSPKSYTGTYGNNGFYLKFNDNSAATAAAIGKDSSGNGNNLTPSGGISMTAGVTYDSMVDSPTVSPTSSNYCVLNPIIRPYNSSDFVSDGNLKYTVGNGAAVTGTIAATIPMVSGKWYAEVYINAAVTAQWVGVSSNLATAGLGTYAAGVRNPGYTYKVNTGNKCNNDNTGTAYAVSSTTGDIIGIAFDADAGSITFYKNGTSLGVAFTGMSNSGGGWVFGSDSDPGGSFFWNFGQRPFTYTPPSGFVALNTQNLPTPTIKNGASQFAATTYVATGAALTVSNAVNNVSFQPDLLWIKNRTSGSLWHNIFDSVRGTTVRISSNSNTAQTAITNGVTSFNSNGFTLGTDSALSGINVSAADNIVAWQWNAGGSTATNTSGTITSQVRANPTAGFSIVKYTGTGANATVGHGLGVAPKMFMVKKTSDIQAWGVWHTALAGTQYLVLNTTAAAVTSATLWNSTVPTSTVFSLGTDSQGNASGQTYVAYCWSEVAGYSKFGSYTGNGSTDGPFVYCGFRPRYVLLRSLTAARDWLIYDTARGTYNVLSEGPIQPNTTNAPYGGGYLGFDILSNGFKLRESTTNMNANAETHIFMAFAENPFKYSLAR